MSYRPPFVAASLTQPPLEVVDHNDSDKNEHWTVKCPNCGRHVNYGTEIFMVGGHIYCSNEQCKKEVHEKYMHIREEYMHKSDDEKDIY